MASGLPSYGCVSSALGMQRWVVGGALGLVACAGLVVLGWWAFIRSVEKPPFATTLREGAFSLRQYESWVVAEVEGSGERMDALRGGFRSLAGYIFAKHRPGPKVAMTAPVLQQPTHGGWTVRFVMPSAWRLDELPEPRQSEVRLAELPARQVAAVQFSGWASDADFERKRLELEAWMKERGLRGMGEPILAYYDDPMVPGPLRRNEVLIPVGPPI